MARQYSEILVKLRLGNIGFTMITKLINRIDFAFLITILASLCGFWMFNYNLIIKVSEYDTSLLPLSLSISHYIITVYIVLILYICFHKSRSIIEENSSSYKGINDTTINVFLKTWPFVIILSLVMCTLCVLGLAESIEIIANMFALLAFVISIAIVLIKSIKNPVNEANPNEVKNGVEKSVAKLVAKYMVYLGGLAIGYFAFLILMTNISIKITAETDKEFYTKRDKEIVMTVKTQGYLWQPFVSVKEGKEFPQKVYRYGNCFTIPTDGIDNHMQYASISIEYTNSMFWSECFMKKLMNTKVMYKEIFYSKTR